MHSLHPTFITKKPPNYLTKKPKFKVFIVLPVTVSIRRDKALWVDKQPLTYSK